MEYLQLSLGLVLTVAFGWLLFRNAERKGIMNGLFRVDTLLGIVAGIYLVITSLQTLLLH